MYKSAENDLWSLSNDLEPKKLQRLGTCRPEGLAFSEEPEAVHNYHQRDAVICNNSHPK